MRTAIAILHLLLLVLHPVCRAAHTDAGLDLELNRDIQDHLEDADLTQEYAHDVEFHSRLPAGWLTPVLPWSDESLERARAQIVAPGTRFTLLRDPADRLSYLAFSKMMYQHPRTREWKHAVLLLSLKHGTQGNLLGEAHYPVGLSPSQVWSIDRRVNREAIWDRDSLVREFGEIALHLEP